VDCIDMENQERIMPDGRESKRRRWKRYLLCALLFLSFVAILATRAFFWLPVGGGPVSFQVSLASKSGIPLQDNDVLLIFEEEWWYTWYLPETYPKFGGGNRIVGVSSATSEKYPAVYNGGFILGPGIAKDLFLYGLAKGHSYSRFAETKINPNVVYQDNPAPTSFSDTILGATYYLEPLSSREDELKNIENIEKTFGLFGRTTEIEIKDEDKKKIESFVRKMREELEEETSEDGY